MTLKFDENKLPFIDLGNDYKVRLETVETDGDRERARTELGETPENVKLAMTKLKNLLKGEKDLYIPLNKPQYLTKFLRCSKYDADIAFEHIKKFYKFKVEHPNYCENLVPSSVRHVFDQEIVAFQPLRDIKGRRVLVVEFGKKWDPLKCPHADVFKAMQISFEAGSLEPTTQISGCVVIMDMEKLSFSQIKYMTPAFAAIMSEWMRNCAPVNFEGFYVVNNPYLFSLAFAIVKPFLADKIGDKIFIIKQDWRTLTNLIGADVLRPCYGGTMNCPQYPGKLLGDLLECYEKEFELLYSYGYGKKPDQEEGEPSNKSI